MTRVATGGFARRAIIHPNGDVIGWASESNVNIPIVRWEDGVIAVEDRTTGMPLNDEDYTIWVDNVETPKAQVGSDLDNGIINISQIRVVVPSLGVVARVRYPVNTPPASPVQEVSFVYDTIWAEGFNTVVAPNSVFAIPIYRIDDDAFLGNVHIITGGTQTITPDDPLIPPTSSSTQLLKFLTVPRLPSEPEITQMDVYEGVRSDVSSVTPYINITFSGLTPLDGYHIEVLNASSEFVDAILAYADNSGNINTRWYNVMNEEGVVGYTASTPVAAGFNLMDGIEDVTITYSYS
jgi:hypothetical protein